jgi:hypothetical protein
MPNLKRITATLAVGLLAACASEKAADSGSMDVTDAPSIEGTASPMDTLLHVTIPLASVGTSGVSGEAMAMHADDTVVLILEMQGLAAGVDHPAHIHSGTCDSGGPVAVALTAVTGLEDGTGASTTTLESARIQQDAAYFIQVHSADGAPVACGDMEGHGAS